VNKLEVMFKGRKIPVGGGLYISTTDAFFRGALCGVSRALRSENNDASTCVNVDNFNKNKTIMRKSGKTRLYVLWRIGYRRLKREHGADEVREKAAEIWKLTSQEKADMEEEGRNVLSESFVNSLGELLDGWSDYFSVEEQSVVDFVLAKAEQYRLISASENEINTFLDDITPVRLRIRKLTPRECGRLMDVRDSDIDKMMVRRKIMRKRMDAEELVLSKSALYKLFGNSVVVNCMDLMFERLFYPKKDVKMQTNLFGW